MPAYFLITRGLCTEGIPLAQNRKFFHAEDLLRPRSYGYVGCTDRLQAVGPGKRLILLKEDPSSAFRTKEGFVKFIGIKTEGLFKLRRIKNWGEEKLRRGEK